MTAAPKRGQPGGGDDPSKDDSEVIDLYGNLHSRNIQGIYDDGGSAMNLGVYGMICKICTACDGAPDGVPSYG